ncbi:hypothetical protein B0H34DRAFT_110148 [Crassisporium funariophilum]|nr:hypothetical protein B0H34DRAFT_110148 [Crassisporium funariophilum]
MAPFFNVMAKRRRLSSLTDQETATLVNLLERFQHKLDEKDGEDGEVVHALKTVMREFSGLKHAPFSDATVLTLIQANIVVDLLEWNTDGRTQAVNLGGKITQNALSLYETTKQIGYIRKHIAFETEAGCRFLTNAIMLHVITNLETRDSSVAIAPESRIPHSGLESGGSSYAGAVNYLMAIGEPEDRDAIVLSPQLAFTDARVHKMLTCSIYEAKPEKTLPALPQAVMEAVIQSQQLTFTTFRGCVTTGEEWLFFIYNKNKDKDGPGGRASYLPPIRLEKDLSGLPLILGLLYDWIENGQENPSAFCYCR